MKLHHFVSNAPSEDAQRARDIGKTLASPNRVTVAEARPAPMKKDKDVSNDLAQQMRDYAISQLEGSEHGSHLHHKIKHYD